MARKLSTSRGSMGLPGLVVCGAAVSGITPSKAKLTTTTLLVLRKSRLFIAISFYAFPARSTALRIRVYVPHRQRFPPNPCLTCSGVGLGVRVRSAFALMIIPFVQ